MYSMSIYQFKMGHILNRKRTSILITEHAILCGIYWVKRCIPWYTICSIFHALDDFSKGYIVTFIRVLFL